MLPSRQRKRRNRRRRRRTLVIHDLGKDKKQGQEERWKNAITIPLSVADVMDSPSVTTTTTTTTTTEKQLPMLQVVGLEPNRNPDTGTVFGRIIKHDDNDNDNDNDDEEEEEVEEEGKEQQEQAKYSMMTPCLEVWPIVEEIVKQYETKNKRFGPSNNIASIQQRAEELLQLGAVWILNPWSSPLSSLSSPGRGQRKKPTKAPTWQRLSLCPTRNPEQPPQPPQQHDRRLEWKMTKHSILRIHCRPKRFFFQMKKNKHWKVSNAIVYLDDDWGICILNKPCGLPSHATVDNGVENILYCISIIHHHQYYDYATLPQRLDTETSGLLVVATKPQFATYCSKLLQTKSSMSSVPSFKGEAKADAQETKEEQGQSHRDGSSLQDDNTMVTNKKPGIASHVTSSSSSSGILKRYRCLVMAPTTILSSRERLPNDRENSLLPSPSRLKALESTIVTHYVDANSSAPKRFVPSIPAVDSSDDDDKSSKWLVCRLRILRIEDPFPFEAFETNWATARHDKTAQSSPNTSSSSPYCVSDVTIELLTGRTHQIRGQLAALGYPIVGDVLYNPKYRPKHGRHDLTGTSTTMMALQCCSLEIPKPEEQEQEHERGSKTKKKKKAKLPGWVPSSSQTIRCHLNDSWWARYCR